MLLGAALGCLEVVRRFKKVDLRERSIQQQSGRS